MKRPTYRFLTGAAGLALMATAACATDPYGSGYSDAEPVAQLVMFEGSSYAGASLPVNSSIVDLVDFRFNDTASSIAVNAGSWEICEDVNFTGRCEVISANAPNLQNIGMNDTISSIRPVGQTAYPPRAGGPTYEGEQYDSLLLYSGTNLRGEALPVIREAPDLGRSGFNDRARSVVVRSGVWEVCTDEGYRGRCETVDRNINDLADLGLSGSISSVRQLPDRPYGSY